MDALLLIILVLYLVFAAVYAVHAFYVLTNPAHNKYLPPSVINRVVGALELNESSRLIDLGCGQASLLRVAYDAAPSAYFVGVENNPILLMLAKLRRGKRNILLQRQDLRAFDLTSMTHVYAYLSPNLMTALEAKIDHELPPGARVVAVKYPLLSRSPSQTIRLQQPGGIADKAYIYDLDKIK